MAINALTAPTHPNPYPYYSALRSEFGFHFDENIKLWIASSAADTAMVLNHPACRVRPLAEPIPLALVGSEAGNIFGSLVRMNDGVKQEALKKMLTAVMNALAQSAVQASAQVRAHQLYSIIKPQNSGAGLTAFAYQLPVWVMADLIGLPEQEFSQVAEWTGDFIRCIAPGGSAEQIETGKKAAQCLQNCIRSNLQSSPQHGLLFELSQVAREFPEITNEQVIANTIGLLTQTYEATAGLIGNSLLKLADELTLHQKIISNPELIPNLISEVARLDPSIQNTRRFVVQDTEIAGKKIQAGEVILLALAAANRDPAANLNPDLLELDRENTQFFSYSKGKHACPGQSSAHTIASAAIACLLKENFDLTRLARPIRYRASVNARVAELEMR